jgi:V/A-type H+-transporting ATPase subunit I
MFGDVGHGLVLFLLGRYLQKKVKEAETIGMIMTRAGVSSIIFGFCFGSIFGYEDVIPALIFHPIKNINTFMAAAVAFGVVFISIGLIINIINSIQARNIEKGVLENHGLAGALFYWGGIGFLIKYLVSGTLGVPIWVVATVLGVPLFVIFLKEPIKRLIEHKRPIPDEPITYVISSLIEVMETFIGFLSNTVSFIRVAAFSLAHAALFAAVFEIMRMIHNGGISFAVEIGGNIVIIVLEGLVVSIQSVRLIFYEFFSKFYSGEGEAFAPMKIGYFSDKE